MMKDFANAIVQSPMDRTSAVVVRVIALSAYLEASTVRRGILYHSEVFARSVALGIAPGLEYALAFGVTLTALTQFLMHLFRR